MLEDTPLRCGRDYSPAVRFLLSPEASGLTGQQIRVDAGTGRSF
ncbi:MAG: hypothetical protein AAB075_06965 [Gemmatimonadota bacterium]